MHNDKGKWGTAKFRPEELEPRYPPGDSAPDAPAHAPLPLVINVTPDAAMMWREAFFLPCAKYGAIKMVDEKEEGAMVYSQNMDEPFLIVLCRIIRS